MVIAVLALLVPQQMTGASSSPSTDVADDPMLTIDLPVPDAEPLPAERDAPAGSRIAYTATPGDGPAVIRVIAADGSGDSRVSEGAAPDWWQPPFGSGDVLAFDCVRRRQQPPATTICLEELDSAWDGPRIDDALRPRWSPAGDALAFDRPSTDGTSWVADFSDFVPRTPNDRPTGETALPGANALWSPTGDHLLVEGAEEQLLVVEPDGAVVREIGPGRVGTWSPDGRRVAYVTSDDGGTRISALSVLTGEQDDLVLSSPISAMRWLAHDELALLTDRDGSGYGDLYVIDLADGTVRSLTAGLDVRSDLSAAPDGEWVAFSAAGADGADIYLAARDGGWRRLTDSGHAAMPAWGSFRPSLERGAFIQSAVDRLRVRSRPSVGDDSARYEPLLSQLDTLEVLDGPVAGSGYWWYRVRLADWEELRLSDGRRDRIRTGWVAAADHDGSRWLSRVDVDPGPSMPRLRTGWPAVRRDGIRLRAGTPEVRPDGSLSVEVSVSGLYPGSALTLVARGDGTVEWRCTDPSGETAAQPVVAPETHRVRAWADIVAGPDGASSVIIELLPAPADLGTCAEGSSGVPAAAMACWEELRVGDALHRLELRDGGVSGGEWTDAPSSGTLTRHVHRTRRRVSQAG
jgi:hypothetical protein